MRYFVLFCLILAIACGENTYGSQNPATQEPLPIIGPTENHKVPDFAFTNQDSVRVTNATFEDKIYVADFFFTNCPTICPKMTKQMLRVYDEYLQDERVAFLSHSIDPKRDTVGRLKEYSTNLGILNADKWHFVTGDRDAIGEIADDYMSIVIEDPDAPGGFDHSGRVILVDKDRQVRSFADGTNPEEVDRLMRDIDQLLAEMEAADTEK